ncbi:MAG: carbon-nitrogen hydrolase family protein [Colwellia sp.]|nr:carbon-nitrogen hydrolase family protein [Colwellia sp.]
MVKLTAIQLCSVPDVGDNFRTIDRFLETLITGSSHDDEHIVVLPECCLFFGGKDQQQLALAKESDQLAYQNLFVSTLQEQLSRLAKRYHVYLVAGSIPLLSTTADKFTNTCCVFSPEGDLITQYDKIHLFDVDVQDSEKQYRESRYTQCGSEIVSTTAAGINVGLSICYDLRFPELYRSLTTMGADIITVPSAFTAVTGKAHWQALLQARAIENQVYIIAAGQQGVHENGRETWGHSMIISPWGEILACLEEGVGSISVDFSQQALDKVRNAIPVAEHNQFESTLKLQN